MIRPGGISLPRVETATSTSGPPWEGTGELSRLAFAALWTTGPDPRTDGMFRLEALRRDPRTGDWEELSTYCLPGPDPSPEASARMAREHGVTGAELEGAPPAAEAFAELEVFAAGRILVVPERAAFLAWAARLGNPEAFSIVDLTSVAGLFVPGRQAPEESGLPRGRARGASGLRNALALLVGRILGHDDVTLAVLAHAYADLWSELRLRDPAAAHELALFLRLLEHPSVWRGRRDELYPEHAALTDGRLTDALRTFETLEDALEAARPRWEPRSEEDSWARLDPLEITVPDPISLSSSDRRAVDEIFQAHLPRCFAAGEEKAASYREGQHLTAASIAERFGERELYLLHAPTGTGKTLAYLVPAMLWAYRNGVRVGVATYTRALQEQAMEHEVPLARKMLRTVGVGDDLRVSVLKGRNNYLCWRALLLQLPAPGEAPEGMLAWTLLALFGLSDETGDLDRFSSRVPLRTLAADAWKKAARRLSRHARAETGCCAWETDRRRCGAEAARRRAERAHVVITNHAFALSRQEFFRHLVFDECEHLHDVAHDAFSHAVPLPALRELLGRLHRSGGAGTRPLNRILSLAVPESALAVLAGQAVEVMDAARRRIERLAEHLVGLKIWREEKLPTRSDADTHTLFREYARLPEAAELLDAHRLLLRALNELTTLLAQMAEHLDTLPARNVPRVRRTLELLRGELEELLAGVTAWLPRGEDGAPAFRREIFYDLGATPSGEDVLVARVLLPNEVLGRSYLPKLAGAVFLSATTWIRGGFEAAATYLGLTRAAHPDEDEEREPFPMHAFRAADAFDYGRVTVAIPRDAPSIRDDKVGFLDYVTRFTGYLAERTRGRILVLFTNAEDLGRVGEELEPFFAERHIPFWYQRMEGSSKEELSDLFRSRTDSVLFGLDTFWYGADFPGETLEYLVIVRLPYGVPDGYHHAQCAALGQAEQRRQIYMPRALAKFRQGFGRLMRKESDRGCVFLLDKRVLDPRHRAFLRELPLHSPFEPTEEEQGAALVTATTDRCLDAAFAHMGMKADIHRRGMDRPFADWELKRCGTANRP